MALACYLQQSAINRCHRACREQKHSEEIKLKTSGGTRQSLIDIRAHCAATCFLRPSPGSFRDARVRISLKMSLFLIVVSVVITSVVAEHSGAYSSPQYAKKMFPKQGVNNIDLLPREKPPVPFKRPAPYDEGDTIDRVGTDSNDTTQYGRSSFLNTAGSFLNGAGGQIVSTLAKDFIARSTGSSQVGFDCISQVRIALLLSFARLSCD